MDLNMHIRHYYLIKDMFLNCGSKWDQLSPEKENAILFAHKFINQEPEQWVKENEKYTWEYVLAHYGEIINMRYRDDRADNDDKKIEKMVNKYTTSTDLVLYRGVCKPVFQKMIINAKNIKGVDLVEKSFLQTSLVKGQETSSDYQLRIFVPTGTHVVYLGNVNNEQSFYEVDIQHGAQLKIVSADKKYLNCLLIRTL